MKKSMTRTGDYLAPEAGLKHGGKVGRGCGAAMKGGGRVMKYGKGGC